MAESGKNKRRQLLAEDVVHSVMLSVDSLEEADFVNWLCEAKSLSVINDFTYQPPPFMLSEPVKYLAADKKERSLFQEHSYTADFLVAFDGSKQLELAKELKVPYSSLSSECSVWIDVKGTFNITKRSFNVDRKWVWQKFKTYVAELVPMKFFKKFGVPSRSALTAKTKKPRTCFLGFKTLKEAFGLK